MSSNARHEPTAPFLGQAIHSIFDVYTQQIVDNPLSFVTMFSRMKSSPQIIDLFAGVGGISLGAARAGFEIMAAVETDQRAAKAHSVNFPNAVHLQEDVATLSGARLLSAARIVGGRLHGLVGGPPCQGFSAIGRNVANDPRNALVVHFCRLVAETNPAFFLFENVPGILQDRNRKVLDRALSMIPKRYVSLRPMKINARDYGAPTNRLRIFFFGYDPDRVGQLTEPDFSSWTLGRQTRVRHALAGLPRIRSHWSGDEDTWRSVRKLGRTVFWRRVSGDIPDGVGDREAIRAYESNRLVSGCAGTSHARETIIRFKRLRAGEVDPVSKARRLDLNGFCPTLRAGTGPDRGSFQAVRPIHPGSPRVITPREAARLQGFPDWFQFDHTKWHAFRQIGNSVSPIVSECLFRTVHGALAHIG